MTEFLRAARDMANGIGAHDPDLADLLSRLSYFNNAGENPANILILIIPIVHLFRLFYGHNVYAILKRPM